MSVRFLRFCSLPACSLPTGLVVVQAPTGRGAGTLEAGVHVGAVVVADVEHLVATLHGAGERLQADVVGAAVAAEGDELDVLVDLALLLERAVGGLDAAERRGGVLEGGVDVAAGPRGVRVDRRRDLQAAGRRAHHDRVVGTHQHLTHDDGGTAAGAHAMAAGELVRVGQQLVPLGARVLEVAGLLERVDRADLDALPAHDATGLVDPVGAQLALVEAERPGRASGDAAPAGDAVGELEGLAVGRVDGDREAAPGEVVAGRAGDVAADAHAAPAGDATVHVPLDERVLVAGFDAAHSGAGDHEVVGRDLVLDAEALQLAVAERRADTLQAAGRLGPGGGQRVALLDLVEAAGATGLADPRHRGPFRRVGGDAHLEPDRAALGKPGADLAEPRLGLELLEVGQAGVDGEALLEGLEVGVAQPGVDGQRRPLAAGDRVDHRLGARHGVAAGEHAGRRRAAGVVVGLERLPG